MSMQPIWNLEDLNVWSGSEAKPTVRVTVTDPDGNNLTAIELKVYTVTGEDPDVDTPAYTTTLTGTWSSGSVVDHNLDYGMPNDTDRFMYARAKDSIGEWGPWSSEQAIKVRWSQAIYEHNTGSGAAQYVFNAGTLAGSSPSAAYIFRSATDAASGSPTYGSWKSSIDQAEGAAYVNILVRLAIGRDTTTATSLTDMTLQYLGAAQQPEKWAFAGDDQIAWTLSESQRRYGTKSLRWIRQSSTMSPGYAEAHTDYAGDKAVVPVVENTKYTISIWVKGTALNDGKVYGYVRLDGETDTLATTEEITGVNTEWTRLTTTFMTPAGASFVEIGVMYESTATGTGDIFYVDAIQLEEGTVASPWNPGQTGAVIVDVGGVAIDGTKGGVFRVRGSDGNATDVVESGQKGLVFGGDVELYGDGTDLLAKTDLTGTPVTHNLTDRSLDDLNDVNLSGQVNSDLMQRVSGVWVPKSLDEIMPARQVGCVLYHNSYFIINVGWSNCVYNTLARNDGCTYNASAGYIYAPTTGWYQARISGYLETAYPGTLGALQLKVNGSVVAEVHENLGSYNAGFWMELNRPMYLVAGQYVHASVYQNIRTMYWYGNIIDLMRIS